MPLAHHVYSLLWRKAIPCVPSGTQQRTIWYDDRQDEHKRNNIAYLKARQGISYHFNGYKHDESTTHSDYTESLRVCICDTA